jgi:site-specific recombinase XerD
MKKPWFDLEADMPYREPKHLPVEAEKFLQMLELTRAPHTLKFTRSSLRHFHRFLLQNKLEIHQMNLESIQKFDLDLELHGLRPVSRQTLLYNVRRYLISLTENELVPADTIKKLFPNYNPELRHVRAMILPELANNFLEVLKAKHKKDTVDGYRSSLRAFYRLQYKRDKTPYKIIRLDIENLMIDMNARKLSQNHRCGRLFQIRAYLEWLFEHGRLKVYPEDLVKKSDFPKTIKTLPRPFPVDVDLEIQKRLSNSNDIDYLGLLLMRRTGLRVGELCKLTLDCVQEDMSGNYFLKVPLGKLNNERVIPLDPDTVKITEKIKCFHIKRSHIKPDTIFLISDPAGRQRKRHYFSCVFQEITKGLAIPGKINLHRLRHSYATSLLSAGLPIATLKKLLGHHSIQMRLGYAAVTQETIRHEYFTALTKVRDRYEVMGDSFKVPDLKEGINRSFYEARRFIKKYAEENPVENQKKLDRLVYRLSHLRHEISELLKI